LKQEVRNVKKVILFYTNYEAGTEEEPTMSVLGLVNTLLQSLTDSRVAMKIDEVDGKVVVVGFEEFEGKANSSQPLPLK
jgi:hypothetical protein